MTIEQRIEKLEKKVNALIQSLCNDKFYTSADISGISKTEADHEGNIKDNRQGIIDTYEQGLVNAGDIADARSALEELYEMINQGE